MMVQPEQFDPSKYPNARPIRPDKDRLEICVVCKKPGYRYFTDGKKGPQFYYQHLDETPVGIRETEGKQYFKYRMCRVKTHNDLAEAVISANNKRKRQIQNKQCIVCGSDKGYSQWHRTANGAYQCAKCYMRDYSRQHRKQAQQQNTLVVETQKPQVQTSISAAIPAIKQRGFQKGSTPWNKNTADHYIISLDPIMFRVTIDYANGSGRIIIPKGVKKLLSQRKMKEVKVLILEDKK